MSLKFLETISANGVTEPELFTGANPTKWKTSDCSQTLSCLRRLTLKVGEMNCDVFQYKNLFN